MRITADDLIAVLEKALDADAQLPTPESAGFATDAIRDFLTFVQSHGGFEVPTGPTGNEPVHFGSLMAGLAIGAVAAGRSSNEQRYREELQSLLALCQERKNDAEGATGTVTPDRYLGKAEVFDLLARRIERVLFSDPAPIDREQRYREDTGGLVEAVEVGKAAQSCKRRMNMIRGEATALLQAAIDSIKGEGR